MNRPLLDYNCVLNPIEPNVKIGEDTLEIGNFKILAYHQQDCCEHVYADFSLVKQYVEQIEKRGRIYRVEIKNVPDLGFVLFLHNDTDRLGITINCYNEQNGYYSDSLEIKVYHGKDLLGKYAVDKKDNID